MHTRVIALLLLAGCSSQPRTAAPPAQDNNLDCNSYPHQIEICAATCDTCGGPQYDDQKCAFCSQSCADYLWCNQCGIAEQCPQ